MHREMTFRKGVSLLILFGLIQTLVGKWMIWSRFLPEGDFALLILLALSLGRAKGSILGAFSGALRDTFSNHPFGQGLLVLSGCGFVSGILGERRTLRRSWQKIFWIFACVFFSDTFLLFLEEGKPETFLSLSAFYGGSVFPSAIFTAGMGLIFQWFLYRE